MFTTLILMTGSTVAIPYGFSALAQIKWRLVDQRTMPAPRFVRDIVIAVLSLVFSVLFICYSRNTGHSFLVYWAPFFLAGGVVLLGIPVHAAQRNKMTEPQAYRNTAEEKAKGFHLVPRASEDGLASQVRGAPEGRQAARLAAGSVRDSSESR